MANEEEIRQDFKVMEKELEEVEVEVCEEKDSIRILRIQIDEGLDEAMKGLEDLKAKLPKEQNATLFEKCTQNALDAIVGNFGLAAAVLDSKDGGNVNTTHNVRKGIYASEEERQRYENRGEYDPNAYHKDPEYIKINKKQSELKQKGGLNDYMTGKKIKPNDKTDLDHIVPAKTINDNRARVLSEVDGEKLANRESNLKMTDSSLNRAKQDKSADEFLNRREERLSELSKNKEKRGYLTESEQKEMEKLKKQQKIDDKAFKEQYHQEEKKINNEIDKAYYTSSKPYKEALFTGGKDAAKMAVHSAIGTILVELVKGMSIELKILFKEFGNESFKDIFKRFKDRAVKIWEDIKARWKDIIAGSFEAGIMAFFSNLIVFLINIFWTTLKKIVQIIRAGFTSLYKAIKIIISPPKDMPKEDVMFEAAKVFVTGLIGAVSMLSSEVIKNFLLTIPGFNAILALPIPYTGETIGDALALCISAAGGAILSTIAIYYMDKYASKEKERKIQLQIMAQSGVVVQYNVAKTWLYLYDAYNDFFDAVLETAQVLQKANTEIKQISEKMQEAANKATAATDRLAEFVYQRKMKKLRNNKE